MRSIFLSFIIPSLISTVISQDLSLFYDDPGTSQIDWDSTDTALLEEPLPLDDSIFDETSPDLLSFNDCSSGGDGWTGKLRRRQAACRSQISPSTEDIYQTPTGLEEKKTTAETNSLIQGLIRDDYMSPPTFEGMGCPNFVAGVLKYTVCATGKRADMTRSTILQLTFLTYSLKNCELLTPISFICLPQKQVWCCNNYYQIGGIGYGEGCVQLYLIQGKPEWQLPDLEN